MYMGKYTLKQISHKLQSEKKTKKNFTLRKLRNYQFIAAEYKIRRIHYVAYNVHYTVYNVYYIVYTVQRTVKKYDCTLYIALYSVK